MRSPEVDFDVFEASTLADSDTSWRELRDAHAVAWTERNGGHWVITRHEEVAEAFRTWEVFSSARTDPARSAIAISSNNVPLLIPEELDPPDWHPMRRILAQQLSPGASERLRPRARHWARTCIDAVIESGRSNLVDDLAFPVPAAVTLEWLGFPQSDWHAMSQAFHDAAAYETGTPEYKAALAAFGQVMVRVAEEVAKREQEPRDDGLTALVYQEVDGERISREVAEALVFMTVGGGVDTTSALTSAALVHLHQHPDDRARLLEDPELFDNATEEFLRCYPPARTHARTVTEDTEFAGCPMKKGDRVVLSEASAGRDERQFPDADRFVIDRFPNRHLSFGAGIHHCLGASLARMEGRVAMSSLIRRFPDLELAAPPVYRNHFVLRGLTELRVSV